MEVLSAREIPARSPSITSVIMGYDYEVASASGEVVFHRDAVEAFEGRETAIINRKRAKGDREIDLKALVKTIRVEGPSRLALGIRMAGGPTVKPLEVVAEVFGLGPEDLKKLEVRRTGAWLKEAAPVRYAGAGDRKSQRGPRGR
jgi:hypothetical protein